MAKYDRGAIVGIRLPQSGTWLTAVVAHREKSRGSSKWVILHVYQGGSVTLPSNTEALRTIQEKDILAVLRAGDVHITDGRWPVIGQVSAQQLEEWPLLPVAMFWGRGGEEATGPYSLRLLHPESLMEHEDLGAMTPQDAAKLPESKAHGAAIVEEVLQIAVDQGWKGRRPVPNCDSHVDIRGSFTDPRLPARTSIGWGASMAPEA